MLHRTKLPAGPLEAILKSSSYSFHFVMIINIISLIGIILHVKQKYSYRYYLKLQQMEAGLQVFSAGRVLQARSPCACHSRGAHSHHLLHAPTPITW